MSTAETVVLERLRALGDGNAWAGYRYLCAAAHICSICGTDWSGSDGKCRCSL